MEDGNHVRAIAYLEKAVQFAIADEKLPLQYTEHTALLAGQEHKNSECDSADTRNLCRILLEDSFSKSCFDPIRNEPQYQTLIKALKHFVGIRHAVSVNSQICL